MALAHELLGNGDAKVIAVNDFAQDTSSYDPIRPYLDLETFSFAFLDLRGYGRSKDIGGNFDSAEASGDILELADALGWDRFSLIGHSMSGMVVQRVMAMAPDRLDKVVATTPVPACGMGLGPDIVGFIQNMATDDDSFRMGISAGVGGRYGPDWAEFKLAANRRTVDPEAMKAYVSMWGCEDFSPDVQGLETPLLVVYGDFDGDGLNRASTYERFAGWYPNLKAVDCPCGHYPMQEVPALYAHQVQDFLRS